LRWAKQERHHGRMGRVASVGNDERSVERLTALSGREPSRGRVARAQDAVGNSARILRYAAPWGKKTLGPPSNGSALRGAGDGIWAAGGHEDRPRAAAKTGHTPRRRPKKVGVAGMRQGHGDVLAA